MDYKLRGAIAAGAMTALMCTAIYAGMPADKERSNERKEAIKYYLRHAPRSVLK